MRTINIPENYRGLLRYFQSDLAVVTLATPFRITKEVRPVCVDWLSVYEEQDLREPNSGVVSSAPYIGGVPPFVG